MDRRVDLFVIHCSDTPNGKHFTVEDIDDWHHDRGFLRGENAVKAFNSNLHHIGYHYVIYVDGSVHAGRAEYEVGAHAQGYNGNSIGICLIGKDKFTEAQWKSLNALLSVKLADYPGSRIKGHYLLDTHGKTCPNFSVETYVANNLKPDFDDVIYA